MKINILKEVIHRYFLGETGILSRYNLRDTFVEDKQVSV